MPWSDRNPCHNPTPENVDFGGVSMTDSELAARLLLVVRSSQEKALRSRFTSEPGNPTAAAAVGSRGAVPERMLEQAIAELNESDRLALADVCSQLIESLKR
jgi:hypothetical protein